MKKLIFCVDLIFCAGLLFSQVKTEKTDSSLSVEATLPGTDKSAKITIGSPKSSTDSAGSENSIAESSAASEEESPELEADIPIPPAKRPKSPDSKKVSELEAADTEGDTVEKKKSTLKFGLESEICDLLQTMTEKEDVRFTNEVYDLFQDTKSVSVREKALDYFAKIEDPCLEDYAVKILADPYEQKNSTVESAFRYAASVKSKAAIPAAKKLLESDLGEYFNGSMEIIGAAGGEEEAKYLADYLDSDDLSVQEKQQLVRMLGKLKAVATYDTLADLAQNKDENKFVRMYSAESIGEMEKNDAIPILVELYEDSDPNVRTSAVKGLAHFASDADAKKTIIQATRDSYFRTRLEAIKAIKENSIKDADEYLIYRAKNDPEGVVKESCYKAIAALDTGDGNDYLVSQITDKKVSDNVKAKIADALLEAGNSGKSEIAELAKSVVKDDRRKPLRYALGKAMAKYPDGSFSDICVEYIESKDVSTQGTGLDMYASGKYGAASSLVEDLSTKVSNDPKKRNANAMKAARILGKDPEKIAEQNDAADAKKTDPNAK